MMRHFRLLIVQFRASPRRVKLTLLGDIESLRAIRIVISTSEKLSEYRIITAEPTTVSLRKRGG